MFTLPGICLDVLLQYCQVNKETDDGVTTVIEIRGSEDGQHMAKELIEELTSSQDNYSKNFFNDKIYQLVSGRCLTPIYLSFIQFDYCPGIFSHLIHLY